MEKYDIKEKGFQPFLIRDDWQVAKLNYIESQDIRNLDRVEVHHKTDEVFVLLKGNATLIFADFKNGEPVFKIEPMRLLSVYNVPKSTWHNIAMEEGSEVLIVENPNTHLHDVDYRYLEPQKISEFRSVVKDTIK